MAKIYHDLILAARAGYLNKERSFRLPNPKITAARKAAKPVRYRDAPYRNRETRQHVVVQASYVISADHNWKAHGTYLAREGANREDELGLGFDAQRSDIDIAERLNGWQEAGDYRQWRIMISVVNGEEMNLPDHTRKLIATMEKDLGRKMEWVAIDHYNTGHPHVHLQIRGVDEKGKMFWIDDDYIQHGLRARAQEIATRELGYRTEQDRGRARQRMIEAERFTDIDREIMNRAKDHTITIENINPDNLRDREHRNQELGRLKVLTDMGLAEKTGNTAWKLSPRMEPALRQMQLSRDIVKSRAVEREQEWEQEWEKRRRNVIRAVDELEQEEERKP